MGRAISELNNFSDTALFETLSEGMRLIIQNAADFDETACRLDRDGDLRGSKIMRGLAEEEAAKILILIDFVRCPRDFDRRAKILKHFYDHVAKRIYVMMCSYPNIWLFEEMSNLVKCEFRPWYLDGPNWVDWIFRNSIREEREQALYVDYVRDDTAGTPYWRAPDPPTRVSSQNEESDCVNLVQALFEAGAVSTDGLAEIADVWRRFTPAPDTDRMELRSLIVETLNRLVSRSDAVDVAVKQFIISNWSFPLWSLTMNEPGSTKDTLKGLREEQKCFIKRIEETEAKRDPAPAISHAKVQELSDAFAAWRNDVDRRTEGRNIGLRLKTEDYLAKDLVLASYVRLQDLHAELCEEERVALVALGWYGRGDEVDDWTKNYERAKDLTPMLSDAYQIGIGDCWRPGLERWKSKPQPFQAGRRLRRPFL